MCYEYEIPQKDELEKTIKKEKKISEQLEIGKVVEMPIGLVFNRKWIINQILSLIIQLLEKNLY